MKRIDFKYNLREYWSFLKKHKGLFIIILLISFFVEGFKTITYYLFKIVVDNATSLNEGAISGADFLSLMYMIATIFIFLIILTSFLRFIFIHLIVRLISWLKKDLKEKYLSHIVRLSNRFHTTHKTGSLISRLTRGNKAIEDITDIIVFNTSFLTFSAATALAVILFIDPVISGLVLFIILSFMYITIYYVKKQEPYSVKENDAEDSEKGKISDIMTNIDAIKHFGREYPIIKSFKRYTTKSKNASIEHWDYFRHLDAWHQFVIYSGLLAIISYSVWQFYIGSLTLGDVVFIHTVFVGLIGTMYFFSDGIRRFYMAMADLEVLFQYGKVFNEIKDSPLAKKYPIKKGEIVFDNVSFRYDKRDVLKNFNLHIKNNEKIALVGHSGSGKSTIIKLLYRLYDIRGSIRIDGKDLKSYPQEYLRGEMTIVPQEGILFDDTLYNNIRFSRSNATKSEVRKAMKYAQLSELIKRLPEGENTIVGERGVRLSGGEKQRVSIARAMLANKKILILDEATSALDSKTEKEIQNELQGLMERKTSIIIAHRLSTVMHADRIIVMQNGKIIQQGNHKELIKRKGEYRKMWRMQRFGYLADE